MKNDNLNIHFSIGDYTISILKFSYECQTWNTPSHFHSSNSYEIHYIPQGVGTLICDGKSYQLCKNILYTTGPYIEHAQLPDPHNPTYEYCIYLKIEESFRESGKRHSKNQKALKPFFRYPFWYGIDHANLPTLLQQICHEISHPGPAADIMLQSLFMQFIVSMLRNYDDTSNTPIVSSPIPSHKAYILIEDSFLYEYKTITLEELSKRLGMSTRQTSRILYDRYGQSFMQKRTAARMAAAATYLQENKLSIAEISTELGYSCPNHFHAAFKNFYHDTAHQYRLKFLNQR